jgi:1-acyl-sn-glycerol-3-phosphate acyltransferase
LNLLFKTLFGFRVYDSDRVPSTGAVIVASNHISLADPPVVGSAISRELNYLGKRELFSNRFLAAVIRSFNTVPVNRDRPDRAALRRIEGLLKSGQAVLLFPEGTRGPGDVLLPGKLGAGKLAADSGAMIVPAYVSGSNCLRRTIFRKKRLTVRFAPPISADWIQQQGRDKEAYRRVVDEVMERIASLQRTAEAS